MESLNRFPTYFTGLSQAFEVSAIATALSKDDWTETFYVDKDVKRIIALWLVFAFLQIIIGIGAALAGLGPGVVGAIASGAVALFGGATKCRHRCNCYTVKDFLLPWEWVPEVPRSSGCPCSHVPARTTLVRIFGVHISFSRRSMSLETCIGSVRSRKCTMVQLSHNKAILTVNLLFSQKVG